MATINPYPLLWPETQPRTPKEKRRASQFKVEQQTAARECRRELELLGAKEVTITTNVRTDIEGRQQLFRNDPGVAVWFLWNGLQRCFACDQYTDVRSNLRAIGLSIEGLRTMERHATQLLNMLMTATNASALPRSGTSAFTTASWWEVLGVPENATLEEADAAYRRIAAKVHPDVKDTGNAEAFIVATDAIEQYRKEKLG